MTAPLNHHAERLQIIAAQLAEERRAGAWRCSAWRVAAEHAAEVRDLEAEARYRLQRPAAA